MFDNITMINRRFSNCFFKAFVKKECAKIKSDDRQKNMKRRKLDNWLHAFFYKHQQLWGEARWCLTLIPFFEMFTLPLLPLNYMFKILLGISNTFLYINFFQNNNNLENSSQKWHKSQSVVLIKVVLIKKSV